MSARRVVWEVARREIVERSRSRVMRISVVALLALSIGGAIAAAKLSGRTPTDDIGIVGARSAAVAPAIRLREHAAGRRVNIRVLATRQAAERQVRDGKIALALIDASTIVVKSSRTAEPVRVVENAVGASRTIERLRALGLTQRQMLSALTPAPVAVSVLEPNAHNLDRNRGLVAIGLMALLLVLVFYGQAVAQGVTEEKSSRVVELLLTTVSPRRLLAGKVLGIGALGLGQLALSAGAGLLAGSLAGGAGLPPAAPKAVALVVLWFVLGYILYSVAFAAAGALVSRQEDLATAMLPINFILLGAFYLALILVNGSPNGMAARIAAFVPPLAPMVAPGRMVLGDMTGLELVAAVAIDLIATAGLIVLAAGIYERAILRTGAPVQLRRLLVNRGAARRDGSRARTAQPESRQAAPSRHAQITDAAGRAVAVGALLGGVAIGLEHPGAIALMGLGLLVVAVLETRKHRAGRGTR